MENVGAATSRPRSTMLRVHRGPMRIRNIYVPGGQLSAPTVSTEDNAINFSLTHCSALRAAFGGRALHAPAGAVARQRPKAPLCKGSWIFLCNKQRKRLRDCAGNIAISPKTNANTLLLTASIPPSACSADTSLYTREALGAVRIGALNCNLSNRQDYQKRAGCFLRHFRI